MEVFFCEYTKAKKNSKLKSIKLLKNIFRSLIAYQKPQAKTPSDEFKWNQLGELYQWFTDTYAHLSLQELKAELKENVKSICAMIDSLSADELFKPHMRKWADDATKAAVWEVYRFIHVNTVAPFGTFRTKIRKWKKAAL